MNDPRCPCLDYPCIDVFDRAHVLVAGHHPACYDHGAARTRHTGMTLLGAVLQRLDATERRLESLATAATCVTDGDGETD